MKTNRRTFVIHSITGAGALALASVSNTAAAQAMVAETDPQAKALGYNPDSTKVDKVKYPKHDNSQVCHTCALFQGKVTDAAGICPLFAGKQVAGKGWCSAWAKKA
jgi:hypothetical protein